MVIVKELRLLEIFKMNLLSLYLLLLGKHNRIFSRDSEINGKVIIVVFNCRFMCEKVMLGLIHYV